mmetsp:Transcript_19204/g.39174  ORF Transcript_19204/g.39174 Transcript_19204/m.39174 type:complete len:86 (-) Transcript_19204:948-1205(-)
MLLNMEDINEDEISRMHAQDATAEDELGEDDFDEEGEYCTPPTQLMTPAVREPAPVTVEKTPVKPAARQQHQDSPPLDDGSEGAA